jgi:DNA-binding NarL/FixJ family response regulator
MNALRILLVDDQEGVRRAVRLVLETQENWVICAEAATGREAVERAKEFTPDVILMDITMPELDGLGATRQIAREVPQSCIIVLSQHESEEMRRAAIDAGACRYVLKSRPDDLVSAIHAARPFGATGGGDITECHDVAKEIHLSENGRGSIVA